MEALQESNRYLAQQLAISEANVDHLQVRLRRLIRKTRYLETQLTVSHTTWQQRLESKENKWMEEYGAHMTALLQIITHHEQTQHQLQLELEKLRSNTNTSRSDRFYAEAETQTKSPPVQSCIETQTDARSDRPCHLGKVVHDNYCSTSKDPMVITSMDPVNDPTLVTVDPHYVTLTMQKLIEQLQVSNQSSSAFYEDHTLPPLKSQHACPSPSSFRASILQRLQHPPSPKTTSNSTISQQAPHPPSLHNSLYSPAA